MVKHMRIVFEKGGEFIAALMEDKARRACMQVREALPIDTRAGQAARSGEVLNCAVPFEHKLVENSKLVFPQGGLALDGKLFMSLYREGDQSIVKAAIVIAYGADNMSFGYSGLTNPICYFAQIKEGLDELYQIGRRNREYGREKVTFSKLV